MSVHPFSTKCGARGTDDKTVNTTNHSILVVDDDPVFRKVVSAILSEKGYEVWEAQSADDAVAYVENASPALVLVDYRLPGMDGIQWIQALRESGNYVPAVLVTSAWIDPTTFKWLRSMLRVSLVMQKPIVPAAFLQSIESIAPPPGIRDGKPSLKTVPDEGYELRTATQHALALAREEFVAALPTLWADFVEDLQRVITAPTAQSIKPALDQAHRLCGTVGSYGLMSLSSICARLEQLLRSLDPSCTTMHQLVVIEIKRCLGEGNECVQQALRPERGSGAGTEKRFTALAVLPEQSPLIARLLGVCLQHDGLQIEFAHNELAAQMKSKHYKYDTVIVDATMDANLQMTKLLRSIPGYLRIPFLFVADEVDGGRFVYGGSSELIRSDADSTELAQAFLNLRHHSEARKPRVLCIDDDPELSKFVEAVLHEEGYVVQSLNEPIHALEVAENFRPDLILVDALMPGLSGFDVCRALKKHEGTTAIPVLFLTATSDPASRACAYQSGAEDFVTKPIVLDELVARTKKYLPAVVDRLGPGGSALVEKRLFMTAVNQYIADKENRGLVLLVTIDDFANLEAAHGALAADQVSTVIARLISLRFRPTDLRTQLDRDRFAVFTADLSSARGESVAQAVRTELALLSFASKNGGHFHPTITVHCAFMGADN